MVTQQAHEFAPTSAAGPAELRRGAAIRVAIAVLAAGGLTAIAIVAIWGALHVKTEIVGYPTFADFNPYNYYYAYALVAGFFPLTALLILVALTRIGPRLGLAAPPPRGRLRPITAPAEVELALEAGPVDAEVQNPRGLAAAAARVAFVGAVLGLEVGIATNHLWWSVVLVVLGYAMAVGLGSFALKKLSSAAKNRLASANALGSCLGVAGLMLVSAHTEVRIAAPGSTHHYPWFPVWLGVPLAVVLIGWILISLRRAVPAGAVSIERRAVLLIAAPVALFVLVSHLPGDLGRLDLFERGQSVTETMLLGRGWLPWRDVVLTHGLLSDVGSTALGWGVFGNSYWGAMAGYSVILYPLTVVATYVLLAYLIGRNWPLLLIGALIFTNTWLGTADTRFLLWPLMLLLLTALLKRPTRLRASVLGLLVMGQAIVTPETAPAVPIVIVVIAAYEWYWRAPGMAFVQAFRRTISSAAAAIALAAAFAIYMASRGALGDVIHVTVNLITGHALDGAVPPIAAPAGVSQARFDFLALAPVAALLVSFAYAVVRLRSRRPFLLADWPMAAAALFLLAYYSKFLARMDLGHVYQPFAIATPLMLYVVYRVVTVLERGIRTRLAERPARWLTAHPIGLALLIFTVAHFWGPLHNQLDHRPRAYRPARLTQPVFARVGYATRFDGPAFEDLQRIIDAYLGPHGRLFDFTNEPALFYYFLGRDPSSRWYAPNGIVDTVALQKDVIKELRKAPPKLIVFDDTDEKMPGLAKMDGAPADVRMYLVSRWILDHYSPLLESHGRTIYALRGVPSASRLHLRLGQQPATAAVPFLGQACDWGYSPTFLTGQGEPPAGARAIPALVSTLAGARVTLNGWAGDERARMPAREVIVTFNGRIIARSIPQTARPDVPAAGYPSGFLHSGFQLSIPTWANASQALRVFAIGQDGSAAALPILNVPARGGTARLGRRTVELQPSGLTGHVDSENASGSVMQIEPPAGSTWSEYGWVEVDASSSGFRQGNFSISNRPDFGDVGHAIGFGVLPRSQHRYIVPVSSCPQWHGYGSRRLFLMSLPAQPIAGIRLIR